MMNRASYHLPVRKTTALVGIVCLWILASVFPITAQTLSPDELKLQRNRGVVMLQLVKDYMKEYYYDPTFHGMDIEVRFKATENKIKEATSTSQIMGIIAQTLSELNDSHTFFLPPPRPVEVDYGWKMQMIGDKCFVVVVKPGSDAEAQDLKPGDEVLTVDGFKPSRQNLWKMEYNYKVLRPQPGLHIVVLKPDGQQRDLPLKAKVEKKPKLVNVTEYFKEFEEDQEDEKKLPRYFETGDVFIWKLREFGLTESKVDDMMKKARQHKTLILDLRGNGGGLVTTLKRMVGYVFDHEVNIGDAKQRKETKSIRAKSRGENVFKGQLIVLVDSKSGSAAELFARVVQIEKRGTVIGDVSAGAVMMSTTREGLLGNMSSGNMIPYGLSVTEADIIMTDGKSLEHVGVIPDELLLPTAADLAAKRDPVLARAAAVAGAELSPEKAGTLFPLDLEK